MNVRLIKKVTEAVFQLGAYKALRLDGFNGFFYQKFWGFIKDDVVAAIISFFEEGEMNKDVSCIDVVMISKQSDPKLVSQFRPISLRNFMNKIITRVMVNRLKPWLGELISENQSAFVAGDKYMIISLWHRRFFII